jgi:putative sugar O-methyltransferase
MKEEPELLDVMMQDLGEQKAVYRPGPYWSGYSKRIVNAIRSSGIARFRGNHSVSKGYADSVGLDPITQFEGTWKLRLLRCLANAPVIKTKLLPNYLKNINGYYKSLSKYRSYYYQKEFGEWLDTYDLPDTMTAGCQEFVEINGKKISIHYINILMRIHNFSQHIDFGKLHSVFEIGGGYGANIHLLLHLYPNIKKVLYLDIPPVLYVGTQYLKQFFRVTDYLATRREEELSFEDNDELEILAICPWQIAKVRAENDLFWNAASFQEMEVDIIRNYMAFINRLKVTTLCLFGQRTLRTHPDIDFVSMFDEHFEMKNVTPSMVSEEDASGYFLGIRKGNH